MSRDEVYINEPLSQQNRLTSFVSRAIVTRCRARLSRDENINELLPVKERYIFFLDLEDSYIWLILVTGALLLTETYFFFKHEIQLKTKIFM